MMNDSYYIKSEYIPEELVKQEEDQLPKIKKVIDFGHYLTSKPKRKILRAKIINDKS